MSHEICELAYKVLDEIPYNEDGISLFEHVCHELDNGTYSGFRFKLVEWTDDGQMMVRFENIGYEPKIWEFRQGCHIYMTDTLCYVEEAVEFMKIMVDYGIVRDGFDE